MALAGVACGADTKELLVQYDFTGDSPLQATFGTGGMQVYQSNGNKVENGTLFQGQSTGFYSSAGANRAIYLNTEIDSWSLTLNATLDSGATCYSVLQFGGSDFGQTPIGFYMGNGSADRGLFGFEIKDKGRWGVTIDDETLTTLNLNYDNVAADYTIAVYDNELHLSVNGVDLTSYITRVDTTATSSFQSAFQSATTDGVCWSKLGYANEVGGLGSSKGAQFHSVSIYQIPEPATATLSLLALAGLAARRRRG